MTPKIWRTDNGFTVLTSSGAIYSLIKAGKGYLSKPCGKASASYVGSGQLCKVIPEVIRKQFFELQAK